MDEFLVLHDDEMNYDATVLTWRIRISRRLLDALYSDSGGAACQGDCPDCKLLASIEYHIRQLSDQGPGSFNTGFGFCLGAGSNNPRGNGSEAGVVVPGKPIQIEVSASIDWDGQPALVIRHRDDERRD
jgi:hypothetical protein